MHVNSPNLFMMKIQSQKIETGISEAKERSQKAHPTTWHPGRCPQRSGTFWLT
jgi:hypothetical protein